MYKKIQFKLMARKPVFLIERNVKVAILSIYQTPWYQFFIGTSFDVECYLLKIYTWINML